MQQREMGIADIDGCIFFFSFSISSFIEASVTGLQSTQLPAVRISAVRAVYE